MDSSPSANSPSDHEVSVAFKVLEAVVREFDRSELALVEIVDQLYNKRLLKYTNEDRSEALQLAFVIVGWISMLYCPIASIGSNQLQILDVEACERAVEALHTPRRKARTSNNSCQSLENKDEPLYTFFRRFGTLIPERDVAQLSPALESPNVLARQYDGWIYLSSICFHTLNKVASVRIEWVDCLSLHLEFNARTKVLKVFRYPSLCFIMCCNLDRSLLSRLFQDSSRGASRADTDDACQFFKEVLLSYRLIFGQTTNSYQDFNNMQRRWDLRKHQDPMLSILCGKSCESDDARLIYGEIDAGPPSNHYNTKSHFPFLGKRLHELQDYVSGHNPHTLTALWYDRRDVSWWWTFWAVIIIGGLTLIFALIQVVLQIIQVVLAQKQLEQGPIGTAMNYSAL